MEGSKWTGTLSTVSALLLLIGCIGTKDGQYAAYVSLELPAITLMEEIVVYPKVLCKATKVAVADKSEGNTKH